MKACLNRLFGDRFPDKNLSHKKLYGMWETSVTLVLRGKRLGGLQSPCSFLVDQMMRIFYVFLHNSTTNITCGSNKIAARP